MPFVPNCLGEFFLPKNLSPLITLNKPICISRSRFGVSNEEKRLFSQPATQQLPLISNKPEIGRLNIGIEIEGERENAKQKQTE